MTDPLSPSRNPPVSDDAQSSAVRARAALLRLSSRSGVALLVVLAVLIGVFSALAPSSFASLSNVRNIAINAAPLLLLAVGETFVIIAGGIDLSVGSVLVFAGVLSAKSMGAIDADPSAGWAVVLVGLLVAIAGGGAWGLVNGLLVARTRIPPLIVTLGTLTAALGSAQLLTGGVDLLTVPNHLSISVGTGTVAGVPWLVIIAGVVALLFGSVLAFTRFGEHTYAIGSSFEAARRAGLNIRGHLTKVYLLQGLLAGLAGWLFLARFGTTSIGGHLSDNLTAIAAVIIGGTSLFGGSGTMLGTVIGILIPAVLLNGFIIVGLQPFWQEVAVGAVLVGAVFVDQQRRKVRERE